MTEDKLYFTPEGGDEIALEGYEAVGDGLMGEVYRFEPPVELKNAMGDSWKEPGEGSWPIKKYIALKVIKENRDGDKFLDAAFEQKANPLDHLVTVHCVGEVREGKEGKDKQPRAAMLMEYWGTDLDIVFNDFPGVEIKKDESGKKYGWRQDINERLDVDPRVAKAFRYKVMIQVVSALIDSHGKGKVHGDLIPRNILCGFDYESVKGNKAQLERAMIYGEIKLCDRRISNKNAYQELSLADLSINADEFDYINHFLGTGKCIDQLTMSRDTLSAVAICGWLDRKRRGSRTGYLQDKAEMKKLGSKMVDVRGLGFGDEVYNDSEGWILPSLRDIRDRLKEYVEDDGYYKVEEKKGDGHYYTVILRPVDRFESTWKEKKDMFQEAVFKSFFETSDCSYQAFVNKAGSLIKEDESKQIKKIFGEILSEKVGILDKKIDRERELLADTTQSIANLVVEKSDKEAAHTGLQDILDSYDVTLEGATKAGAPEQMQQGIQTLRDKASQQVQDSLADIDRLGQRIRDLQAAMGNYDITGYTNALQYVADNINQYEFPDTSKKGRIIKLLEGKKRTIAPKPEVKAAPPAAGKPGSLKMNAGKDMLAEDPVADAGLPEEPAAVDSKIPEEESV